MKRNVLLFISLCVVGCVMTYAQQMPGPVSYTHLDVYKRQVLYRAIVGHSLGEMYGYKTNGVYTTDDFVQNGDKYVLKDGVISVSYTHLDVYKRQPLTGLPVQRLLP